MAWGEPARLGRQSPGTFWIENRRQVRARRWLERNKTAAIQRAFQDKRDQVVRRARAMGMQLDREPEGTFYVWGSVANLPAPISDGMSFFRAALEEKVIVVPGEFFDVNPGKRRAGRPSRFRRYVRLSFGPGAEIVDRGMTKLEALVARSRGGVETVAE